MGAELYTSVLGMTFVTGEHVVCDLPYLESHSRHRSTYCEDMGHIPVKIRAEAIMNEN